MSTDQVHYYGVYVVWVESDTVYAMLYLTIDIVLCNYSYQYSKPMYNDQLVPNKSVKQHCSQCLAREWKILRIYVYMQYITACMLSLLLHAVSSWK